VLKEDPEQQKYGVLGTDDTDRITTFAGRVDPVGAVTRERMFCGVHLVDPRAFDLLPPVTVAADGTATGTESGINDAAYPEWMRRGERLYAFDHASTFCDVGTPERLLEANLALLAGTWSSAHLAPFAGCEARPGGVYVHPRAQLDPKARVIGPVFVDDGAVIEPFADVGPFAVVGKRAVVKRTARIAACVVHADTVVADACVDAIATPAHRVAVDGRVGQGIRRAGRE
jgi:NDP-sugar pyrophosphorylase family protein